MLVIVISGFWHGADWTFVIWGALHAFGAIATRLLERSEAYKSVPFVFKRAWVFAFVCLAWIFFRAESVSDAMTVFSGIFTKPWEDPACPPLMLMLVVAVWFYQWMSESRYRELLELGFVKVAMAVSMIIYLALAASGGGEFIYFQF